MKISSFLGAIAALALFAGAPFAALADPPPHAPAHGWRAKHDPYYVGYTGRHWRDDYGIRSGRCDRDRACLGHSLELLDDGRAVRWDGVRAGMLYTLTPGGRFEREGRVCRRFMLVRETGGHRIVRHGRACRFGDGDRRMIRI